MIPNNLADLAEGQCLRHWLVLGPFVVRTGAHFEREYMYERERILDIDYLAADGGEASVTPAAGQRHANVGLGPKHLAWFEYAEARLDGDRIAGDLIYETVQRNCVIYAAAAIESDRDGAALLDAYHSGMKVWVNGQLACNMPYGLPKGVRSTMPSVPIRLRKGHNLVLFKFRPGYICDGIDFCVRDVRVSPLASRHGWPIALGRVRPLPHFRGTPDAPRQVFEAALLNTSHVANTVRVTLASDNLEAQDVAEVVCEPQQATSVRLSLPVPRDRAGTRLPAVFRARLYGERVEAPFEYETGAAPTHNGTVLVASGFHFDTTYYQEQRVYAMGAFDIVRQYCRLHRQDPRFRSHISEVDYLKPYFDVYPEDRATLLEVFREGRSEPDVMYNQPNEQNCGDEALVRNFLYGQLIHGRVFGGACRVYGPGDVFGHPNQLSQIARKAGCIGVAWDKLIFNFPPFFEHLALDGSSLPHKRGPATEDEAHDMGLSVRMGSIDQTPPTDWHATLMPEYKQGTYGDLAAAIGTACEETGAHLPVTSRDMSLYHAATAVSRVNLKIANRLGESLLLDAEKVATIANALGARYPEKALDKAWRQLLCGQHHDSITGTHNEISYVDLMSAYREALELGSDVLERALTFVARAVQPPDDGRSSPYVVFNPLAWTRTDVVRMRIERAGNARPFSLRDDRGRRVPFEVLAVERNKRGRPDAAEIQFVAGAVPSMGYRAYTVAGEDGELPARTTRAGTRIENEYYRVTVDPARGGGMVSLFDKHAKREVLDTACHVGNELAVLEELPYRNETQHEFYTTGLKLFSGDQPASVEVEKGPVSATLRARYSMGELCDVVQEITLYKGVPRVECRTLLLDVQREDYLYAVTFPTNLQGCVPVFDERFGAVARNDSRNYLDFRTHQMVMFSDCAVYAANKWMEYGSCATVKVGGSAYPLSMVGLVARGDRVTEGVAETIMRTLITKGVTCTPWRDAGGPRWGSYLDHMDDDLLYTRFRISLGVRGNNRYSRRLIAAQPAGARRAFERRLAKQGYAFLFVKDGHFLKKDGAWPALPVLIVEAASARALRAAVEELLAEFPATATITLPAGASATRERRRVDDYGVALLNQGTYANSVEQGGTLCMILQHTCRWYGGTNTFPEGSLVPEHKNHVFSYALFPHEGDWREAGTSRAAHAFNHPLRACRAPTIAKPYLPSSQSFLSIEPKNVMLAAMKPWGNPMAAFEGGKAPDALKGIALRLYDTEGLASPAWIRFGKGVASAWRGNLLEEREGDLPVADDAIALDVPPFSIETVGLVPRKLGRRMYAKAIGAEAEPVQPVWVRSWEHDAESMPTGYGTVVCSISREVVEEDDGRTLRLKVNAVNDYTDVEARGEARLLLPAGWTAEPAVIPFELSPLGHAQTSVIVRRPDGAAAGQVKLRHECDGQVFQDVLEMGGAFDLEMTAENRSDEIVVTVHNPTQEAIEAEVALVAPLEMWGPALAGPFALGTVAPRTRGVSVAPGATVELPYTVSSEPLAPAPQDSYWAVAKLMSNGRIQLRRCDNRPPERRMWSRKWRAEYRAARNRPGKREYLKEQFDA